MNKVVYDQDYFDALYQQNEGDPWRYEQRWYEARKRQLTLAALPQQCYQTGIEIGCSNGVLSEALSHRCKTLHCLDAHATAIELAQLRLGQYQHVQCDRAIIPQELPEQQFDLIVASEILYYLDDQSLATTIDWFNHQLTQQGTLLSCHWRHPIDGFKLNGDDIHAVLNQEIGYFQYLKIEDPDFLIQVWTGSSETLSMEEQLR